MNFFSSDSCDAFVSAESIPYGDELSFNPSEAIPVASAIQGENISLLDADFYDVIDDFFSDDDKCDFDLGFDPPVAMAIIASDNGCIASAVPASAVCFAVPANFEERFQNSESKFDCGPFRMDSIFESKVLDDDSDRVRMWQSQEAIKDLNTIAEASCEQDSKAVKDLNRKKAITRWLEKKAKRKSSASVLSVSKSAKKSGKELVSYHDSVLIYIVALYLLFFASEVAARKQR